MLPDRMFEPATARIPVEGVSDQASRPGRNLCIYNIEFNISFQDIHNKIFKTVFQQIFKNSNERRIHLTVIKPNMPDAALSLRCFKKTGVHPILFQWSKSFKNVTARMSNFISVSLCCILTQRAYIGNGKER